MAKISFETTQEQDNFLREYAVKNLSIAWTDDISSIIRSITIAAINLVRSNKLKAKLDSMRISEVEEALNDYELKTKG